MERSAKDGEPTSVDRQLIPTKAELKEIFKPFLEPAIHAKSFLQTIAEQVLILGGPILILEVLKELGNSEPVLNLAKSHMEKVLAEAMLGYHTAGDIPHSPYNQRLMETLEQA